MIKLKDDYGHKLFVCDLEDGDIAEIKDREGMIHLVYIYRQTTNGLLEMISLTRKAYHWSDLVGIDLEVITVLESGDTLEIA